MALLHQAELTPSKLELLNTWIYGLVWFVGDTSAELVNVAAFRFDDPNGEVGVETILIRAGDGPTLQVPLTYRGAPLDGAESSLIGTMEHSVLGKRWVYDGASDPVYVQTVATAALNGGHQAELTIDTNEGRITRTPNALVTGSGTETATVTIPEVHELVTRNDGSVTVVDAGNIHLRIQRVIGGDPIRSADSRRGDVAAGSVERPVSVLTGTWTGCDAPQELVLATLG